MMKFIRVFWAWQGLRMEIGMLSRVSIWIFVAMLTTAGLSCLDDPVYRSGVDDVQANEDNEERPGESDPFDDDRPGETPVDGENNGGMLDPDPGEPDVEPEPDAEPETDVEPEPDVEPFNCAEACSRVFDCLGDICDERAFGFGFDEDGCVDQCRSDPNFDIEEIQSGSCDDINADVCDQYRFLEFSCDCPDSEDEDDPDDPDDEACEDACEHAMECMDPICESQFIDNFGQSGCIQFCQRDPDFDVELMTNGVCEEVQEQICEDIPFIGQFCACE